MISVGDKLPSIELHEGSPATKVDVAALFAGKRGILFAVPGAFTPGCDRSHLPGYVADAEKLHAKGVEVIACVSVNDAFVMGAWGAAHHAEGKVRMLADPLATFTQAVGLDVQALGLGGTRSKRYALLIDDGVVKAIHLEPDGFGLTCSLSNAVLAAL